MVHQRKQCQHVEATNMAAWDKHESIEIVDWMEGQCKDHEQVLQEEQADDVQRKRCHMAVVYQSASQNIDRGKHRGPTCDEKEARQTRTILLGEA